MTKTPQVQGDSPSPLLSLLGTERILQSMPMGIVVRNSHGDVINCNTHAEEILGVHRDEVVNHATNDPIWRMLREDGSDFPIEQQPSQVTLATGQSCVDVIMGVSYAHQSYRWMMTSTSQLTLEDGTFGVISTFFDVTQRIQSRRLLILLAAANRIIVNSHDEDECLAQLCDALVNVGRFRLALVEREASPLNVKGEITCASGSVHYLEEGEYSGEFAQ